MLWKILLALFITYVINAGQKEPQREGWVYVPKMDSVRIKIDTANQIVKWK